MKKLLFIMLFPTLLLADSFNIDSSSTVVDATHLSKYYPQRNYGNVTPLALGDTYIPTSRIVHFIIKFPTLRDSMQNIGSATWDSAKLGIVVQSVVGLSVGTSIPDSLLVTLHKITSLWDEGSTTPGGDSGGVTYDSASATGVYGLAPNQPLAWNTNPSFDTDDYFATAETQVGSDTIYFVGGAVSQFDTIYFRIGSTTLSDTLDEGLVILTARVADGDDAGDASYVNIYSDDESNAVRQPWLEVFYTPGVTNNKKVQKVYLRKVVL